MAIIHSKKITIVKINRPAERDINKELQWLGYSLGLFNLRDKDKSCYRIFLELLKSAKKEAGLSSATVVKTLGQRLLCAAAFSVVCVKGAVKPEVKALKPANNETKIPEIITKVMRIKVVDLNS